MNKSEIKNKMIKLFNSIDSENLSSTATIWYSHRDSYIQRIDENGVKVEELRDLLNALKNFINNLEYFKK
jgi:hypothetical protein